MSMTATMNKAGNRIDYTPGSAVEAGDVVVQASLVGVATEDIAANAIGSLAVTGNFSFPKSTGSSTAIPAGTNVYWDAGSEVATATAGSNKRLGVSAASATDSASTVDVLLGHPHG
jgi:predicted RecA/RadA family phage recombinase